MTHLFGDMTHDLHLGLKPWEGYTFLERKADFSMAAHEHPYLQIIHVLAGVLEVDWGASWVSLRPGEVHVQPPGMAHALRSHEGYEQFGLNCTAEADERGLLPALVQAYRAPAVFALPFRDAWEAPLRRAAAERTGRTERGRLRVLPILDAYALALLAHQEGEQADARAVALLEYLDEHRRQRLDVEAVALALHMSRATLQRLCQQHFRTGVAHLYERVRLEHAARLLVQGAASVSACAEESGYADVYHFSRAFTRVYGVSPRAYRNERPRAYG